MAIKASLKRRDRLSNVLVAQYREHILTTPLGKLLSLESPPRHLKRRDAGT